jgi:hypothetical protein
MIPPLLLSLTIFLSLSLLRLHLSHQLSLSEQSAQINLLEQELERLRTQAVRRGEREKRERERMLPVVVGKVLQRVGVLNRERDEEEELEEEEGLLVWGMDFGLYEILIVTRGRFNDDWKILKGRWLLSNT